MLPYRTMVLLQESERLRMQGERELRAREAAIVELALEIVRGEARRPRREPAPKAPLYGALFGAGELAR